MGSPLDSSSVTGTHGLGGTGWGVIPWGVRRAQDKEGSQSLLGGFYLRGKFPGWLHRKVHYKRGFQVFFRRSRKNHRGESLGGGGAKPLYSGCTHTGKIFGVMHLGDQYIEIDLVSSSGSKKRECFAKGENSPPGTRSTKLLQRKLHGGGPIHF